MAEEAALKMISLLGADSYDVDICAGQYIRVTELATEGSNRCRVLHLCCGNMLDVKNICEADIVMMETDVPSVCQNVKRCHLILQRNSTVIYVTC